MLDPLPVHGYKPQNQDAIDQINRNKEIEEVVLRLCDRMKVGRDEYSPFDQRWLSIAVTHFEQGFMALNRAISKPGRVKLDVDEAFDRIMEAELENMIGTTEGRDNGV